MGAVRLPSRPTEVVIALSVLLLACELAARNRRDTLTMRRPWLVAFAFGLRLHWEAAAELAFLRGYR